MKKKVRTSWIEFFKTGRFYNYIESLDDESKKKKEKPKNYHWELLVTFIDGHISSLSTIEPDSDDFKGDESFNELIEWFQCSDNPSYIFRFKNGLKLFVRNKITEIQLMRKEK